MDRKLTKRRENRLLFGVCSGLAEYFQMDVTLIRLVFAALGVFGGSGIVFYIAAAIIMPEEE